MSTFVVASIHVCIAFRLLGQNNRDASSSIQWKMQPRQTHFQKTDVGLENMARDSKICLTSLTAFVSSY